jgi:hypothetical protein
MALVQETRKCGDVEHRAQVWRLYRRQGSVVTSSIVLKYGAGTGDKEVMSSIVHRRTRSVSDQGRPRASCEPGLSGCLRLSDRSNRIRIPVMLR